MWDGNHSGDLMLARGLALAGMGLLGRQFRVNRIWRMDCLTFGIAGSPGLVRSNLGLLAVERY
jgi:hypothetical protein